MRFDEWWNQQGDWKRANLPNVLTASDVKTLAKEAWIAGRSDLPKSLEKTSRIISGTIESCNCGIIAEKHHHISALEVIPWTEFERAMGEFIENHPKKDPENTKSFQLVENYAARINLVGEDGKSVLVYIKNSGTYFQLESLEDVKALGMLIKAFEVLPDILENGEREI